jgi:hypothetical protein
MANKDCNGDFFTADRMRYYRCLWDGTAILATENGDKCSHCGRIIDGTEVGEFMARTVRIAISKDGMELRLPERKRIK